MMVVISKWQGVKPKIPHTSYLILRQSKALILLKDFKLENYGLTTVVARIRSQVRSYGIFGARSFNITKRFPTGKLRPYDRGGPDSIPGQVIWNLWWTKWHQGRLFRFPCPFSSLQILHSHQSSGAGTTVQLVAEVPSRLRSHLTQ
jgi:hypothetical protein